MILAIGWYVAQLLSALTGARAAACPPTWCVNGAHTDGTFVCLAPVPLGVCDTRAGCVEQVDLAELYGKLWCRAGERALTNDDGRGVRCGGES